MAESKYYKLFNEDNIDESILKESVRGWSFEDHYWHMACLTMYYKNTNQEHLEKNCLSNLCDLNYVFNALSYYETLGVLPVNYKKYIVPFNNSMVDEKINFEIERLNKDAKRKQRRKYFLSSLTTLLTIPLMLFLMLVCKLDANISVAIAIVFLIVLQTLTSPFLENTKFRQAIRNYFKSKKKIQNNISKDLNEYLKYLDRFVKIVNEDHYKALARAKDDEEIKALVKAIKEKKLNV